MRLHLTAFFAGLALFGHSAGLAQTPQENAAPASIKVSLLPGAQSVDASTQAALIAWLSKFQKAVHQMRFSDYMEMVDWDTLIETGYAGGPEMDAAKKLRMKKILVVANERSFPLIRQFFQFQDAEIRRLDLTGDKAVVVARIHDEDDMEYKVRWWLQRRGGQWLMTDFENISVNMRLSAILQMGAQAAAANEGFKSEQSQKLTQVGIAVQDGEFDKAYTLIKELEATKLPAVINEFFLAVKASVLSQMEEKKDEFESALLALEKVAPENPVLLILRTSHYYDDEDYKNAIVWAKKIGATVGHDADTWEILAESHRNLKEDKEFLAAAEGWVADYPNLPLAVWALWEALPAGEREARIKPLLEKLTPAEDALTTFGGAAEIEDDATALKLVISVMQARKVAPEAIEDFQTQLKELLESQKKPAKDAR
ncbi:hypothetical protein [Prosthecobacter sp.]|uniref:hypothetical protein n=1 Tax=Prosthecobacter sp. TaxID=1965333 RepID=UPI00378434F7